MKSFSTGTALGSIKSSKREAKMFLPLICLWLVLPCSYAIEYSNSTSFAGGNYTARWKFDNETEIFHFKVVVKASGWVGFGISRSLWPRDEELQWNRNSMHYYDVVVGGVYDNGTKYFQVSFVRFPSDDWFKSV